MEQYDDQSKSSSDIRTENIASRLTGILTDNFFLDPSVAEPMSQQSAAAKKERIEKDAARKANGIGRETRDATYRLKEQRLRMDAMRNMRGSQSLKGHRAGADIVFANEAVNGGEFDFD